MKISTTEQIERYLFGELNTGARLLFEAKLIIDPVLKRQMRCQQKLYAVIRQSGRRALKLEVDQIHQRVFNNPEKKSFHQQVFKFFQQP